MQDSDCFDLCDALATHERGIGVSGSPERGEWAKAGQNGRASPRELSEWVPELPAPRRFGLQRLGVSTFVDQHSPSPHTVSMAERTRKITVNVPVRVLENAVKVTGKGVTSTVVEGLEELDRRAKRSAVRALRGTVRLELDLERTRR